MSIDEEVLLYTWMIIGHVWLASCRTFSEGWRVFYAVFCILMALAIFLCSTPVHADGGISGVIGAIISAGQPTSTSPDNYSNDGDDGDD